MARRRRSKEGKEITFRRIGGRIVPIAIGGTSAAVAYDAARTRRIYQKGPTTIDVKHFAFQPYKYGKIGPKLQLRVGGKKAGSAFITKWPYSEPKAWTFSWLGVKKPYRGKGFGKLLTKEAARVARRQGGESFVNQVVHRRSVLANYNPKRDQFWTWRSKFYRAKTKKQALKNIAQWKRKGWKTSDIWRETNIKGIHLKGKNIIQPYMTKPTKVRLGLGLAGVLGIASYSAYEGLKK